jgi:hypothetical protein
LDAHRGHEPGSAGILAGGLPGNYLAGKNAGAPKVFIERAGGSISRNNPRDFLNWPGMRQNNLRFGQPVADEQHVLEDLIVRTGQSHKAEDFALPIAPGITILKRDRRGQTPPAC